MIGIWINTILQTLLFSPFQKIRPRFRRSHVFVLYIASSGHMEKINKRVCMLMCVCSLILKYSLVLIDLLNYDQHAFSCFLDNSAS